MNGEIRDQEVRVIGSDGQQLGIMSSREALHLAEEYDLDLVKISPTANPPVCKIMDYGKFKFEQGKKEKESRKNQKLVEIKEVRLSMTIDTGDMNVKSRQTQKFLEAGNKVMVSIRLRGRQNAHASMGVDVMNEFFELLGVDTKRLVWIDTLTKYKKLYIPEVSMVAMKYYTKEYQKIYETIKTKAAKIKGYEKVFYTTSNFSRSPYKDFGELKAIEKIFADNGYKIVSPEQKTLKEQISIMQSCKEFAAISETLPHNILFANKGVNFIIMNKSYVINYQQWLIDDATGIIPAYIDVHCSILPGHVGRGPFFYRITDNLIKYLNDNNMIMNYKKDPDYYKKYYFKFFRENKKFLKVIFEKNLPNPYTKHYLKDLKINPIEKLLVVLFLKYTKYF